MVAGSEDKTTCSDFRRKDENRKLPPKPLSPKAADPAVNSLRAKAGAPRGGLSPLWSDMMVGKALATHTCRGPGCSQTSLRGELLSHVTPCGLWGIHQGEPWEPWAEAAVGPSG